MKAKVIKKFRDIYTQKEYFEGQEIEITKKRFDEIISKGEYVEEIKEKEEKPTKEPSEKTEEIEKIEEKEKGED